MLARRRIEIDDVLGIDECGTSLGESESDIIIWFSAASRFAVLLQPGTGVSTDDVLVIEFSFMIHGTVLS
jgi:hypothetical protein